MVIKPFCSRSLEEQEGQAIIEMSVCLIAFLIVLGTLLQIGLLGHARTRTMMDATREATEASSRDSYTIDLLGSANYIQAVEEGDDDSRYSADDDWTRASSGPLDRDIVAVSDPGRLGAWAGPNRLSQLYGASNTAREFEMVRGYDSQNVRLQPMVRNLMSNEESIEVEAEVFMPWLKGIY